MAYLGCPRIFFLSPFFPPQTHPASHSRKPIAASATPWKTNNSEPIRAKNGKQLLGRCNPQRSIMYVCCSRGDMIHEDEQGREAKTEKDRQELGVEMALSLLRFYRREISPLIPTSCRYVPTCSEYAMQAYKRYGVVKGTVLTAWRLCRCNPFGGSGFDPPRWFGEGKPPPR